MIRADVRRGYRLSVLPRWIHQWYAWALRYFWVSCPLCGSMYGGHEWRDINGWPSSTHVVVTKKRDGIYYPTVEHRGICPACTRLGLGIATGGPLVFARGRLGPDQPSEPMRARKVYP